MIWVLLTVVCYTLSSLGDKFISAKLNYRPAEFSFIVSFATAFWIGVILPFQGWALEINTKNIVIICILVLLKIVEFYTSSVLLKTVSAYELKAWLGINVISSYVYNVIKGKYDLTIYVILFSILLLAGIAAIVKDQLKNNYKNTAMLVYLCLLYTAAKFIYGLVFGLLSDGCSTISVLFIVMLLVGLFQLPAVKVKEIVQRKGIGSAAITRIPNAIGLITESIAAVTSVFLYAMVQPIQLAILFIVSLINKKEKMSRQKLIGSLLCLISVCILILCTL